MRQTAVLKIARQTEASISLVALEAGASELEG